MPITIKNEDILTGLEKFTVDVRKSLIILIEAHRKGIFSQTDRRQSVVLE